MFSCKLCKGELHSTGEIVGTYCGHVFHQICLDGHLKNDSACPSCKKSLKVNMALLATLSHDLAILPLHLEKCYWKGTTRDKLTRENMILKQKVVELSRIIILQEQKRDAQKSEVIYENMFPVISNNEESSQDEGTTKGKNKMESTLLPYAIASRNTDHLSERTITPWTDTRLTENEKDKILRSKRRECLTWRNKAQTWLSKMEKASDKLLRAEACFTEQEYLEQLLLFYNKLSQQGEIIETAKKASLIHLIIGTTSEAEKETTQFSMQDILSKYEAIMMTIINRLYKLNMHCNKLLSPKMALINKRAKREFPYIDISSSNNFSSNLRHNDLMSWITADVSFHPNPYMPQSFASLNLPLDVEYSFTEPIYV